MKKVKTTKTELKQILKEEIKHILNENVPVPPMDESGAQAEEIIQTALASIKDATQGNEELMSLILKRIFQELSKETGVEAGG
jgi:hypothetical protein